MSEISAAIVILIIVAGGLVSWNIHLQQAAEDLGVRYVLEGSVQRSGEHLRVNAQLINALNGHHV